MECVQTVDRYYMLAAPENDCYDSIWYANLPKAIFGLIAYGE